MALGEYSLPRLRLVSDPESELVMYVSRKRPMCMRLSRLDPVVPAHLAYAFCVVSV